MAHRVRAFSEAGLGILVAPVPISPVVCISRFALRVSVSRQKSPESRMYLDTRWATKGVWGLAQGRAGTDL